MNKQQITCPKCGNAELWVFDAKKSLNENGWSCVCYDWKPGEPEGFCPELDREEFYVKVDCILLHLHMNDLLYVSNSTGGESLVHAVVKQLEALDRLDTYSIIEFLYKAQDGHAEFWQGKRNKEELTDAD